MELLSGGEMLVRALHESGVEYIYGYPGGSLLHVYDALYKQSAVKHVLVRHEQAAAHMADGYARATGKPGVVMVTSGPGATNTITGIATAYTDSIPMVVISGQVMSYLVGRRCLPGNRHAGPVAPDREAQLCRASSGRHSGNRRQGLPYRQHRPSRARW